VEFSTVAASRLDCAEAAITVHPGTSYAEEDFENMMVNTLPSKNKRHAMHLLFTPILASGIWIGGGSVGLLLIIVVVVLLLRGR
jgi:tetrahydromethanopterin S-methyltransferase subunit B